MFMIFTNLFYNIILFVCWALANIFYNSPYTTYSHLFTKIITKLKGHAVPHFTFHSVRYDRPTVPLRSKSRKKKILKRG